MNFFGDPWDPVTKIKPFCRSLFNSIRGFWGISCGGFGGGGRTGGGGLGGGGLGGGGLGGGRLGGGGLGGVALGSGGFGGGGLDDGPGSGGCGCGLGITNLWFLTCLSGSFKSLWSNEFLLSIFVFFLSISKWIENDFLESRISTVSKNRCNSTAHAILRFRIASTNQKPKSDCSIPDFSYEEMLIGANYSEKINFGRLTSKENFKIMDF